MAGIPVVVVASGGIPVVPVASGGAPAALVASGGIAVTIAEQGTPFVIEGYAIGGEPIVNELLVVSGQSLAVSAGVSGAGGLPSGWANTARVQMWSGSAWATYNPGAETNWGPEVAYAKAWLDANAANTKTLYIVKHADPGSQLAPISTFGQLSSSTVDWSNTTGSNYRLLRTKVQNAQANLTGAGTSFALNDILWIQGESDSHPGDPSVAAYSDHATALYSDMRADFAAPTANIITHTVSSVYAGFDYPGFLAEQRVVANLSARNFIVDMAGVTYQDQVHPVASGINIMGSSIYGLTHGGLAPTGIALSNSTILASAAVGDTVGTLSATSRDAKAAITFTLQSTEANFELVSGNVIRVKTGASLSAGTEDITVRATNASGFVDQVLTITIAASQWWMTNAIADIDYENDRAYVAGASYASITAARTAGAIVQTGGIDRAALTLPASYTVAYKGVTSAAAQGATGRYAFSMDDGADGAATDMILFLYRGLISSGDRIQFAVNTGDTVQLDTTTANSTTTAVSQAIRASMRLKVNDVAMSYKGGAVITDATFAMPTLTRLIVGDRDDGLRPWGGTHQRIVILNEDVSNANLPGLLA